MLMSTQNNRKFITIRRYLTPNRFFLRSPEHCPERYQRHPDVRATSRRPSGDATRTTVTHTCPFSQTTVFFVWTFFLRSGFIYLFLWGIIGDDRPTAEVLLKYFSYLTAKETGLRRIGTNKICNRLRKSNDFTNIYKYILVWRKRQAVSLLPYNIFYRRVSPMMPIPFHVHIPKSNQHNVYIQ